MNAYKITYRFRPEASVSDANKEASFHTTIIERTEKAARKEFAERMGLTFQIESVEVVDENATATKEQERAALDVIRRIVRELGPHSYIATALAGTLEDAENNIEDDTTFSMQARNIELREKLRQEIADHQETKDHLNQALTDIQHMKNIADGLREQTKKQRETPIPADLWQQVYDIVKANSKTASDGMMEACEVMGAAYDMGGPTDLARAWEEYKKYKQRRDAAKTLVDWLAGIAPANAEF